MAIEWHSLPFLAENTDGTSVIVSGALNQSGYIYSVIVPAASGVPSSEQIAAGQDSASGALGAGFYDSEEVSDSGIWASLSGYGLTSETDYVMYVVGSGYDDGLMSSGYGVAFTTPDITAPNFSGTPSLSNITGSGVDVTMAFDDVASGFALALASGTAAPTPEGIVASGQSLSYPIANAERTIPYTGLVSETDYEMYVVGRDAPEGNLQSSGWLVGYFTTSDITAPEWFTGYPTIGSITTSTAIMSFKLNDAGSGYFVIVPSGSSSPSSAQVKAGTDSGDTAIATGLKGRTALVSGVVATANVTGLTYAQYYTVYAVGEDEDENATSPAVVSTNFRAALPGVAAPSLFMRSVRERRRLDNALRTM